MCFEIFKLIKELLTNRNENPQAITEGEIQRNMNNTWFLQRRIMNTIILNRTVQVRTNVEMERIYYL